MFFCIATGMNCNLCTTSVSFVPLQGVFWVLSIAGFHSQNNKRGRTERFFIQLLFHYPISVTFSTSFDGGTVSSHLWILLSVVFQVLFIVQLNESNNNDCYKFFKTVYVKIIRGLDAILGK